MLNYKEIKIGNIFKRGIKISNILDIDQEYAKKNQNDNKKLVLENEGDKFIENSIIPVLNKLYKNYDKINLKFTNEDVKYRNIACKNVKIKEEISRVYLGVNNYFKYSF